MRAVLVQSGLGSLSDDQYKALPKAQQDAIQALQDAARAKGITLTGPQLTVNGNVIKIDTSGLEVANLDQIAHDTGYAGFSGVYTFPPEAQVGPTAQKKSSWFTWALGAAVLGGVVYAVNQPGSRSNPAQGRNHDRIRKLDEFSESYIDTALWSTSDESSANGGEPLNKNYDLNDINQATFDKMVADAEQFQTEQAALLEESGLSDARAGELFWLNRNGHGHGFWGEDLDDAGEALSEAAHEFGEYDLYVGDDGLIYGS